MFRASFAAVMTGIIGGVSIAKFVEIPIPLPPLEEQHRIVAKIDQLMARYDALEILLNAREEKRLAIHAAALSQLLDTKGKYSSNEAWAFLTRHFGDLYTVKENVSELRKAILQLAVMGKLVPHDPLYVPAGQLLKEIEAEKKRLLDEGKLKKNKLISDVSLGEIPYSLPQGWIWTRLGRFVEIKGGKRVANGYKLLESPTPYIYIRVTDMKNGSIDDSNLRYIDENMHAKIKQYIIAKEDIYMTIVGATIGKCGLVPQKFDGMNLTENAARLILPTMLNRIFLFNCLASEFCQRQFVDKTKQVGVQKMALNRLASTLIPLPPLAEQDRIVEKTTRLMSMCDALDHWIAASASKKSELLNSVADQM